MKDITKHLQQELQDNAGREVVIPDGEFKLSETLIVPPGTKLLGTVVDEEEASKVKIDHPGLIAKFQYPCKDSEISNIGFNGYDISPARFHCEQKELEDTKGSTPQDRAAYRTENQQRATLNCNSVPANEGRRITYKHIEGYKFE